MGFEIYAVARRFFRCHMWQMSLLLSNGRHAVFVVIDKKQRVHPLRTGDAPEWGFVVVD